MTGSRRHLTIACATTVLLVFAVRFVSAQQPATTPQPARPEQPRPGARQRTESPEPPQPSMPDLPKPSTEKPASVVPPPLYPTTPPADKQFIFERVYNYRAVSYKPPIVIQRISRDSASNATPEQAFAAQMSAMLAGDFDWWASNWDAAAQKFHKERDLQTKRSPADWRAIWDKALKGQQIRLTDRMVTGPFGPYVMLIYEMHDAAGKLTFQSSFVAKEEAGRWVGTLDLSEDPLFQYHDLGKDRVTVTVR